MTKIPRASHDAAEGVRGPASRHMDVAVEHADLGLPVPRRARFRLLKRMLGRVMWVFGRDQATYNHAMLEAVAELANSVEMMRMSIAEHVGDEVGGMRSQVGALEVEVRELQARVEELASRLGAANT
jgi:hypothetical protein